MDLSDTRGHLVSQTVTGRPTISQDTAVPGREPTRMPALSPTAIAMPTATPPPTLTPTTMPTPTIAPAPIFPSTRPPCTTLAQPAVTLAGLRHEWQTWNNCGPATLAMLMSFFGSQLDRRPPARRYVFRRTTRMSARRNSSPLPAAKAMPPISMSTAAGAGTHAAQQRHPCVD